MSVPEPPTTAATTTTSPFAPTYNTPLDILYGTTCCLCFLVGVPGNIASLIYFMYRKRDVSTVLYRIITLNDFLICLCVLPAGISFLAGRTPGFLFGNDILCNAWVYVWVLNLRLSVFLVVVLCCSRTYSLLNPFGERRCRSVALIVGFYFAVQLGVTVAFQSYRKTKTVFVEEMAICGVILAGTSPKKKGFTIFLEIFILVDHVAPIFVVIASSVVSTVVLFRSESSGTSNVIALKQSRSRATITILLFAAVYGIFNIPVVISKILYYIDIFTQYKFNFHAFEYDEEFYYYFENFTYTLSVALNSTINPLLYLWRMDSFRKFNRSKLFRILFKDSNATSRFQTAF
jgi:hypothetical protein